MEAQEPATGILKHGDFGDVKFYYIQCTCGSEDCSHDIEVEAGEVGVSVYIYVTQHTKWWEANRWKQIWQILTKGYAEIKSTIVMDQQTAFNYANALTSAVEDVKQFRNDSKRR